MSGRTKGARMKGPGIFLAQFMGDPPFDTLEGACGWMAEAGYLGVQLPSNDVRCMDLERAAESQDYCDDLAGRCAEAGVAITELSAHIQGQLVAVHPAYDEMMDAVAPTAFRGRPEARAEWAARQVALCARASRRLGLDRMAAFSGALLWPYFYAWPQRPPGLVEEGFAELAARWRPILDACDAEGVDVCYELHPGEDLHDGVTFERFLVAVGGHPRAKILYDPSHFRLQGMDEVGFIDAYHERIGMFHVKDAEFRPNARAGAYGGYLPWKERPGRFRSLGDGQIDFRRVFSQLTQHGYDGWAVVEWECALKDERQGAREGAAFVRDHMIEPARKAFDDFAGGAGNAGQNRRVLGLTGGPALAAE